MRCTPRLLNLLLRSSPSKHMLRKHHGDLQEVLTKNLIPHTKQKRHEPMARAMCIRDIIREMSMQGENPLDPGPTNSNLGTLNHVNSMVTVINVDVRVILPNIVEPLPILLTCTRSFNSYEPKLDRPTTLRTPNPHPILPPYTEDVENKTQESQLLNTVK